MNHPLASKPRPASIPGKRFDFPLLSWWASGAVGQRDVVIFAAMATGINMDQHRRHLRLRLEERLAHLFSYPVTLPGGQFLIHRDLQFCVQGVPYPAQAY